MKERTPYANAQPNPQYYVGDKDHHLKQYETCANANEPYGGAFWCIKGSVRYDNLRDARHIQD